MTSDCLIVLMKNFMDIVLAFFDDINLLQPLFDVIQ